jgi:hypothetical protein
MLRTVGTFIIATVTVALLSCSAKQPSSLVHLPYPQLIEDSTWVAARAISYVRYISVSEGYANQLNTAYTVTHYTGDANRVQLRLAQSQPILGGGVTVEILRSGAIRILERGQ